jgi:hypothetical protein
MHELAYKVSRPPITEHQLADQRSIIKRKKLLMIVELEERAANYSRSAQS